MVICFTIRLFDLTPRLCFACLQATTEADEAAVVATEADIATDQALCDKHAEECVGAQQ